MRYQGRTADQELARAARASHGVVRREQLFAAGLTKAEITTRLHRGTLIRVHRGVYRVGHQAPSVEARYLAAVWACGEGALLCGLAAGYLLALLVGGVAPPAEVVARGERRIEGVRVRRSRGLDDCDAFVWRGVPVTSVARTMVDLASVLSVSALARAFHEAGIKYGTTPEQVDEVLERRANSRGAAKLRAVIHGDEPVLLSFLERRFRRLLREAGLPLPETNRRRAGGGSIAAGPSIGSLWSSTATAFTAHGTHGSATAFANARRGLAATISGASPSATWSSRAPCWPNSPWRCPD